MARQPSVRMDIQKMRDLIDTLRSTRVAVRVGVVDGIGRYAGTKAEVGKKRKGGASADSHLTNAQLAKIHEFGSPQHGLPARSMLNVPLADHRDEWIAVFKNKAEAFLVRGKLMDLYALMGVAAEKIVDGAFRTGGYGKWPALTRRTLMAKLSGSLATRKAKLVKIFSGEIGMGILIRTAQLRKSFGSEVVVREK